jgi:transposase, IS5 family
LDRVKGGRPPYDAILMFKVLALQTLYTLSDEQTEYLLKDRLSFMRFVGLALHDPVPDAKTIWLYLGARRYSGAAVRPVRRAAARDGLTGDGRTNHRCHSDPSATTAPDRGREGHPQKWREAVRLEAGAARPDRPRRTLDDQAWAQARCLAGEDQKRQIEIAVPVFGYKNHVGIDCEQGFLRRYSVTHAAAHDGQRGAVLDRDNTASDVWADTAYRSAANLACSSVAASGHNSSARNPEARKCRTTSPAAMLPVPG